MKSKNKPAMTVAESRHVSALAQQPCVVCDAPGPSEIHEFEQGLWFASVPLCYECHRGTHGWHGTRQRWTLKKTDAFKAIDKAVGEIYGGVA